MAEDYLVHPMLVHPAPKSTTMPSSFLLVSRSVANEHVAHLANGNIGLQTTPLGLGSSCSFMIGVLDLSPEDVTRPARIPDWHGLEIRLDDKNLAECVEGITGYTQVLDMEKGWLETEYTVRANGASCRIACRHILARHDGDLALIEWNITALSKGTVELVYPITAHKEPTRYPFRTLEQVPPGYGAGFQEKRMTYRWHPGHMFVRDTFGRAGDLVLGTVATAKGNGPSIGICVALACSKQVAWRERTSFLRHELTGQLDLNASETLSLTAFAAFSRGDEPGALLPKAENKALAARQRGAEAWKACHTQAWRELWRSDIIIEGDATLQLQARRDLFSLLQSTRKDSPWSVPVMGIASSGYNGAIFWDADLYMYPALLPLHPSFARGFVDFRYRTLGAAFDRARKEGRAGAKYPWESDLLLGDENIAPNTSNLCEELHSNSGVALAQWWYFCCTGDLGWLRARGFPVISAVAEFWASRVEYLSYLDQYALTNVHCVNESSGMVNNCVYTNASAARTLEIAATCAELLGLPADPRWKIIVSKMRIPKRNGLFLAHDQATSGSLFSNTLLSHPLEWPMTDQERGNCLMPPYTWDMSLQACLAGMVANPKRMREYFDFQASHFINPPFLQRAEAAGRDSIPMHTGCGAFLQGWVYGVTGMRWRGEGLVPVYAPCLPDGISSVTITSAQWHGRRHLVEVKGNKLKVERLHPVL